MFASTDYFQQQQCTDSSLPKTLQFVLNSKRSFNKLVNQKINKCKRIFGLMKRLSLTLLMKQLLTFYQSFVRSHLDYTDIIYEKPFNDAFKEKLETVQHSAALIITGAIKGISLELLYNERGLECLCDRGKYHKLVLFYKIIKSPAPSYLQSYLLPENERTYNTRAGFRNTIKTFATRISAFRAIFFIIAQKNGTN